MSLFRRISDPDSDSQNNAESSANTGTSIFERIGNVDDVPALPAPDAIPLPAPDDPIPITPPVTETDNPLPPDLDDDPDGDVSDRDDRLGGVPFDEVDDVVVTPTPVAPTPVEGAVDDTRPTPTSTIDAAMRNPVSGGSSVATAPAFVNIAPTANVFASPQALPPNNAASAQEALGNLRNGLEDFLPDQPPQRPPPDDENDPPPPQLPDISVSIVKVEEKTVGIGNTAGFVAVPGMPYLERRGGRLEVTVRFYLWDYAPDDLDAALLGMHQAILTAKDNLKAIGFLKIKAIEASPVTYYDGFDGWGLTADYEVLYEYTYIPSDDAYSFIARIPVNMFLDRTNPLVNEGMLITGDTVRWDDLGAPEFDMPGTTPLRIQPVPRKQVLVTGYAATVYIPSGTTVTGSVTLTRRDLTRADAPADFDNWAAFISSITATDPDRHAAITFASLADFLALFTEVGEPVQLLDRDVLIPADPADIVLNSYQPMVLSFPQPVVLDGVDEALDLTLSEDLLPEKTVVYIRAEVRRM